MVSRTMTHRRGRNRTTGARTRRTPARRTSRKLPRRDARGRFVRRRKTASRRSARRPRTAQRAVRVRPAAAVVRRASEASRAEPPLVKRRWWRIDGPVDPDLPAGYAYRR